MKENIRENDGSIMQICMQYAHCRSACCMLNEGGSLANPGPRGDQHYIGVKL
jgi:hypothetical protein